jgi:molybdopterin-guanine dinucleotide biosynthesis protein A
VIGVVLAGGEGRRLGGGSKAVAQLAGRAVVEYPLEALAGVCERVAVVCKRDTRLPQLPGTERWDERPRRSACVALPPAPVRSVNTPEQLADAEAPPAAR